MNAIAETTAAPSRAARRGGIVVSALVVAFLVFDGTIKLIPIAEATEAMAALGYPATPELARGLGVLLLVCTALYAWPATSPLGAILITGYLGGTIATHLRVGNPWFSHMLFGGYLGVLAWLGLWLRDPRLRTLLPWRRS